MDRLIVKNFGPLKDVDIELNKINLFIGENGSGKSVLGKIITIITSAFPPENIEEEILEEFKKYNIPFFLRNTIILYKKDKEIIFQLKNKKILKYKKIEPTDYDVVKYLEYLTNKLKDPDKKLSFLEKIKKLFKPEIPEESNEKLKILFNEIQNPKPNKSIKKAQHISQYIPAERNLISIFSKSISSFLIADIPLPKFLLSFSSEYEKARNTIQELNLLEVQYQFKEGRDYIIYDKNDSLKNSLPLENSSSGIQSALPLYLTVKYFSQKHESIIIEEPEQNLFPKAQSETIKYIVEQVSDENSLFLMTHSPYVLSTLNILMMAHKAGNLNEVSKSKVTELYNEKQWINPDEFSAYYLENGVARDIKGRTGLISDNEIDESSDNIQGAFEELLAIYREHKNVK